MQKMKKIVIILLGLMSLIAVLYLAEIFTLNSRIGKKQTSELKAVNNAYKGEPANPWSLHRIDSRDSVISEKVRQKIAENQLLDLKADDLPEIQAYLAGEKEIPEDRIVDFRVLIYRFYNQVKVEGDKLVCTAGSGSEIGISEDVFQFYKEDLARLNADMVKMEDRPDEDALRENLEDQLRQILTL